MAPLVSAWMPPVAARIARQEILAWFDRPRTDNLLAVVPADKGMNAYRTSVFIHGIRIVNPHVVVGRPRIIERHRSFGSGH